MKEELIIKTIDDLPSVAKKIVERCKGKKNIAFYGEMGAGKTTLIKAICHELGVEDTISSPTFSIVNEYKTNAGEKIFHFDFYRIKSETEAYDMGYEDYFYSNAYCFIEWPEKIKNLLPENTLNLNISLEGSCRLVSIND